MSAWYRAASQFNLKSLGWTGSRSPLLTILTSSHNTLPVGLRKIDYLRPWQTKGLITTTIPTGEPTIFALSTAPGKSAIAIIRISGPASLN
ncbi:MAG: hypothetical protein L6R40_002863, partial [Gallowayella cf. fulva]